MSAVEEKKAVEALAPPPQKKPAKGFKVLQGPIEFSGPEGRTKAQTGETVQLGDDDAKLMLSLGAVETA